MDGVSIMNNLITTTTFRPSVDAIQETQIQTGTYPAQYGHYMGVQINVITKGGTNRFTAPYSIPSEQCAGRSGIL